MTPTAVIIPGTPLLLPGATGQPVPDVIAVQQAVGDALTALRPTAPSADGDRSPNGSAPDGTVHIVAADPHLSAGAAPQRWASDTRDGLAGFGFPYASAEPTTSPVTAPAVHSSSHAPTTRVSGPADTAELGPAAAGLTDSMIACSSGDPDTSAADAVLPTGLAVGRAMAKRHLPGRSVALWAVAATGSAAAAVTLGNQLTHDDVIVVADGSACLGLKPPRGMHPDAEGVQRRIVAALAGGDGAALLAITEDEAATVHVTGRAALHALAGWANRTTPQARLVYEAEPWGVGYVVARWRYQR